MNPTRRLARCLAFVLLLSVLGAGPAAAGGAYVGAFGGLNLTQKGDFADGSATYYGLGGAFSNYGGYAFDFGLRLGGGITYRLNATDKFNGVSGAVSTDNNVVASWAYMGNAFWDFKNSSEFTPYLGLGLGFAVVTFDETRVNKSDSDVVLAGELGAGVAIAVGRIVRLTADYRFFITEKPEVDVGFGKFDFQYMNHSVLVGVRIDF